MSHLQLQRLLQATPASSFNPDVYHPTSTGHPLFPLVTSRPKQRCFGAVPGIPYPHHPSPQQSSLTLLRFGAGDPFFFVTWQQPNPARLLVVVTSPLCFPPPGRSTSAAITYPGASLTWRRCPKPTLRSSRSGQVAHTNKKNPHHLLL